MPPKLVSSVADVLKELKTRRIHLDSLLIAIDGRGGAGKSSFARNLVAEIPGSVHIEYDWFHFPKSQVTSEKRFDHSRVLRELIEPFIRGVRSFQLRRYNWGFLAGIEDGFHADPVIIDSATTLVIEGCDALNRELAAYYGLRIWIDTDAAECHRRGVRRDIEDYKLDPDKVKECWREWVAQDEDFLRLDDRRGRADLLVK
jgi:uridine kinase